MSKAEETVVYKFSDFTQECAESTTEFDQKQWVILIEYFHEAEVLFRLVYKLGLCNTLFSGSSLVAWLLTVHCRK